MSHQDTPPVTRRERIISCALIGLMLTAGAGFLLLAFGIGAGLALVVGSAVCAVLAVLASGKR